MSDFPRIRTVEIESESADSESILIPKMDPDENRRVQIQEVEKEVKMTLFSFKIPKDKWKKVLAGALILLFVFIATIGALSYRVFVKAQEVRKNLSNLQVAVNDQDLDRIKGQLDNLDASLGELKSSYQALIWIKILPFIGGYVSDGQHALYAANYGIEAAKIVVETIEPYADIIGFSKGAKQAGSGQETAQDRIDFVVKTIPDLIPKADSLTQKVQQIRDQVDQIDPNRYPDNFAGKAVRAQVKKGIEFVDLGAQLIENSKPLLEVAPSLLGADKGKRYLVLFQNDKELRPTGGFITAYSIAKVEKGRFEPVLSDDIYNLDSHYRPKVEAPEVVRKYLKGPYLLSKNFRLRDMNWYPDFSESMNIFSEEIEDAGIKNIDGIIAVDTQVVVNILDVIGTIGVPGFGDFGTQIVSECNCPQVIYELESFADIEGPVVWSQDEPGIIIYAPPNYDNRKKIIGPLMNSILANALGQPKSKLPDLFEAVFRSLTEKHALFYFFNDKAQSAVEKFGIAGTISDFAGDYLHINDSNLGGRKSNLYITQEIAQKIEIAKDGSVIKTVTISYKNPEKYDGWLNSVLPNWVRIYVPKGSELISFDGVEDKKDPYEEFGKEVFAGFFELRPLGVAKVNVTYKLPFRVNDEYKLLIQKQPGTNEVLQTITLDNKTEEFFMKTDKELKFKL